MAPVLPKLSLSLLTIIAQSITSVIGHPHAAAHKVHHRDETPTTTTPVLTITVSPCPIYGCGPLKTINGFQHACQNIQDRLSTEDANKYAIICDVDFPGQTIYPFLQVRSFDECKSRCEEYNTFGHSDSCAGFVFAPTRRNGKDDCYLKSSLAYPMAVSVPLVGATLKPTSAATPSTSTPTSSSALAAPTKAATSQSSDGVNAAAADTLPDPNGSVQPAVATVKELGASVDKPTNQYVSHLPIPLMKLATGLLTPGINNDLITKYPLAGDTGIYSSNTMKLKPVIKTMKTSPKIARDGGKGGMINGTHVVVFCDTAVTSDDQLVSLVSSSVATDSGMNALYGNALELVDNLGEWQDDVGRMRGLAPMTTGEQAFNTDMSGSGYRYAIWPESSLIPINLTHALIYASIVYDQVNMTTQSWDLSPLGNTLLVVAVDPVYGPYASRPVLQLFQQGEIKYGSLGGFRAWGKDGPDKMDGDIYLFGQVDNGVFLAKTSPILYNEKDVYRYWDGSTWAPTPPDANSHNALILNEPVKDFDLIYSPYFKNFFMIYLTNMADNTLYWRYCQNPGGYVPVYQGGPDDWAEAIRSCAWSGRQVMYNIPKPEREFVYAASVHAGYYRDDDITQGGRKMLISWTEKTGQDASSPDAGYAHKTAYVDWAAGNVTPCPNNASGC